MLYSRCYLWHGLLWMSHAVMKIPAVFNLSSVVTMKIILQRKTGKCSLGRAKVPVPARQPSRGSRHVPTHADAGPRPLRPPHGRATAQHRRGATARWAAGSAGTLAPCAALARPTPRAQSALQTLFKQIPLKYPGEVAVI